MALLSVQNLSVSFYSPQGDVRAVRGVSFEVNRGETLAIVGESGSGKSVTALSILRLIPSHQAKIPGGKIIFDGMDLSAASEEELRKVRGAKIGMIFQEPMTSLNPLHRVGRQIVETLVIHRGEKPDAAKKRAVELLGLVGIPDPEVRVESYPHELSGGQRQRVMIAMALANDPSLLIADEPTTALDVTIQAQILALLDDLKKKLGLAVLLITHDLGIVEKYSDRVCVMTKGEIVETGPTAEVFASPKHPYTRALKDAEPGGENPVPAKDSDEILRVTNLSVRFPIKKGFFRKVSGWINAVDGVNLTLKRGSTLGVVGESGSGKTTLAMAILKLVGHEGEIALNGQDVGKLDREGLRKLRGKIQVVFQDPFASLSPRMSAKEIIEEGLLVHFAQKSEKERDGLVVEALGQVGLDPADRFRYPHEFSGGQRQRIAIARALVLKPEIIVLDEPTSALDRSVQAQIVTLLWELKRTFGLTFIFISHDLKVVRAISDEIIVMKDGKIVESGSAKEIFTTPRREYTRQLINAAFELRA